jgi:murein DD-endopeptidase MepM/ murein hydrolase activator NlpD
LKIEHEGGWATGYGHLSAYAKGLHVGEHVAQGQVVAYVGSTGLSTGPHLHYEVMHGSEKMNPASAKVPQGTVLQGRDLAAFRAQKAHIDALLTHAAERDALPVRTAALDPRQPAAGSIRGLR